MTDKLTPVRLDEIEARLAVDYNMSSAYTKARVFPHLFPIGRDPHPCAYGKPHAECEMHNTWLDIDGERRRQCDCTEDDELVLEYIVTNDVPALVAEVRELRAKVERVRALHRENVHLDRPVSRCRDCDDVWPCETARSLGEEA